MTKKVALITGITGQDGSYLAELLLSKGYEVHGIKRRSSSFNTQRLDHFYQDPHLDSTNFFLHYADMTDTSSIESVITKVKPSEIYNLAAQSHVAVSFEIPLYTAEVNALGPLRIFEAIRKIKMIDNVRIYQASSSELFGLVQEIPQKETTPFYPRSPYAVAKLFAYWAAINYREAYDMHISNGILFNHESSRRGETFVTRKITMGLSDIFVGNSNCLFMGNLNSKRDWGHAKDYVYMQYLMLQQESPGDFVISTGKQYSIRDFIKMTANELGFEIKFEGSGIHEVGIVDNISSNQDHNLIEGQEIIKIDPKYFRPSEVEDLLGNSDKAKELLNWVPDFDINLLVKEMIENDLDLARRKQYLIKGGFTK
jgi:GDPmannose 4,6-dehydratase